MSQEIIKQSYPAFHLGARLIGHLKLSSLPNPDKSAGKDKREHHKAPAIAHLDSAMGRKKLGPASVLYPAKTRTQSSRRMMAVGRLAEWSIAPVLKTGKGQPFVSSNLTPSAKNVFKLLNSIVIYCSSKSYPYFYPCRHRRANCPIAGVPHPRIGLARMV